jgi:hypothetical protein
MSRFLALGLALFATLSEARPLEGTPVVVDQQQLLRRLEDTTRTLGEAMAKSKPDRRMRQLLEAMKVDLQRVREQVLKAPALEAMTRQHDEWTHRRPDDHDRREPHLVPARHVMLTVMPPRDFDALRGAMGKEGFSDGKLRVLNTAAPSQGFTVAQVSQLIGDFSFSKDKLDAARILSPRIVDPQNNFKLYEAFSFSADKEELKKILTR